MTVCQISNCLNLPNKTNSLNFDKLSFLSQLTQVKVIYGVIKAPKRFRIEKKNSSSPGYAGSYQMCNRSIKNFTLVKIGKLYNEMTISSLIESLTELDLHYASQDSGDK